MRADQDIRRDVERQLEWEPACRQPIQAALTCKIVTPGTGFCPKVLISAVHLHSSFVFLLGVNCRAQGQSRDHPNQRYPQPVSA
jgi:hypothetical protein